MWYVSSSTLLLMFVHYHQRCAVHCKLVVNGHISKVGISHIVILDRDVNNARGLFDNNKSGDIAWQKRDDELGDNCQLTVGLHMLFCCGLQIYCFRSVYIFRRNLLTLFFAIFDIAKYSVFFSIFKCLGSVLVKAVRPKITGRNSGSGRIKRNGSEVSSKYEKIAKLQGKTYGHVKKYVSSTYNTLLYNISEKQSNKKGGHTPGPFLVRFRKKKMSHGFDNFIHFSKTIP